MSAGEYYNHTTFPVTNAAGSSASMRAELEAIETGFGKLPDLSGNGSKVVVINAGGTAMEAVASTGTGAPVRATSPTLVTPVLGVATATSVKTGSGTIYAEFAAHPTKTALDIHAFEDWSTLNAADTGVGYASFDAKPTLNNANAEDHFVGFQCRLIHTGVGGITTYMDGMNVENTHSGGTVAVHRGIRVSDVAGGGTITTNYGAYIDPIAAGATNWSIYARGGQSWHAGKIKFGGAEGSAVPVFQVDVAGSVGDGVRYGDGTQSVVLGTAASKGIVGTLSAHSLDLLVGGTTYATLSTTGFSSSTIPSFITGNAPPAGGTTGLGLKLSSTANLGVFFGSGAPTLSAAKGSLYLRTDGSTTNDRMYVNTDGGTTWTAAITAV